MEIKFDQNTARKYNSWGVRGPKTIHGVEPLSYTLDNNILFISTRRKERSTTKRKKRKLRQE